MIVNYGMVQQYKYIIVTNIKSSYQVQFCHSHQLKVALHLLINNSLPRFNRPMKCKRYFILNDAVSFNPLNSPFCMYSYRSNGLTYF